MIARKIEKLDIDIMSFVRCPEKGELVTACETGFKGDTMKPLGHLIKSLTE